MDFGPKKLGRGAPGWLQRGDPSILTPWSLAHYPHQSVQGAPAPLTVLPHLVLTPPPVSMHWPPGSGAGWRCTPVTARCRGHLEDHMYRYYLCVCVCVGGRDSGRLHFLWGPTQARGGEEEQGGSTLGLKRQLHPAGACVAVGAVGAKGR